MSKDPYHITYDDLIEDAEKRLRKMEQMYPRLKLEGKISDWAATRSLTCARTVLKLLKRYKRNPQLDLFQEFEKQK